jgi:hypothetical protein
LETILEQTQDKTQDENTSFKLPMKCSKNFEFEKYTTPRRPKKDVTAYVILKLHEWFTCIHNGTTTNKSPLCVTSYMWRSRKWQDCLNQYSCHSHTPPYSKTNYVLVCGATGSAAFNADRLFNTIKST